MTLEQTIKDHPHFTIHNLPYGVYSTQVKSKRVGVAIGDHILDLSALFDWGIFQPEINDNVFAKEQLNDFIALGSTVWAETRKKLKELVTNKLSFIEENEAMLLDKQSEATMYVPVHVGDYTDFYSSEEHASNVGKMFRPAADPLLPNWKHMPIAYHGRSSSIITTNTPVKRPHGQILKGDEVIYAPSQTLDIEIELGFIIGKENTLGVPVNIKEATEYIFGCVLLNDFSARDIQRWEYQPLGPFLGKNFATAISPWIITYDALKEFLTEAPVQKPAVLAYLDQTDRKNFDIDIHFNIKTKNHQANIAVTNAKFLYWTAEQQIAHHTVNGCNLRIGDLLGTGTISGKEKKSFGSLLEITWNGKEKIMIGNEERTFLENGDTAILTAFCQREEKRIGFGELSNLITG
ncbi:fumarylacetoacetase [Ferruginibacter lapsinanis]|uniref:fumarylacetoacetase n=1 Tax=Ferruginibacter lapsinanis TaxID=563172 RepID=UPI001E384705|nr:fumarylacetoacetase [Ferruginibacter lapsinanis]UEG50766.1 fumarylacetoacetase [Ferruginibacter lapsinanis]